MHYEATKQKQLHLATQTGGTYYIFPSFQSVLMGAMCTAMHDGCHPTGSCSPMVNPPWGPCLRALQSSLCGPDNRFLPALPQGPVIDYLGLWNSPHPGVSGVNSTPRFSLPVTWGSNRQTMKAAPLLRSHGNKPANLENGHRPALCLRITNSTWNLWKSNELLFKTLGFLEGQDPSNCKMRKNLRKFKTVCCTLRFQTSTGDPEEADRGVHLTLSSMGTKWEG